MNKFTVAFALLTLTVIPAHAVSSASSIQLAQATGDNPQQQLIQLRKDWANRDPALRGPEQLQQQDAFQRRALALAEAYENSLRRNPNQIQHWLELAEVQFIFLNRFEAAENALKQALTLQPDHVQANIARAEFDFFVKKDVNTAIERLENQLTNTPQQPDLLITLADLRTRSSNDKGVYDALEQRFVSARQAHPQHEKLQYMQAFVAAQKAVLGKSLDTAQAEIALNHYEKLVEAYPTARYALETAQIARQLKQPQKAHALIDQALKSDLSARDRATLIRAKGDLWLEAGATDLDAGRWSEALEKAQENYRKVLPAAQMLVYSDRVQFYYNLGLLAYNHGRAEFNQSPSRALPYLDQAVQYYQEATRLFDQVSMINAALQKDMARALEMKGMVYQKQNEEFKAKAAFEEACNLKLESSCKRLGRS